MKKEEFLAFSLPYRLKLIFEKSGKIIELQGLKTTDTGSLIYNYGDLYYDSEICNFKPILHKLSDLTKEIEHNGEKFIPIIELAKISFDVCSDLSIKVKSKDKISGCIFIDEDDDVIVFVYHHETQSFCAHQHFSKQFLNVHYQLKMIQKLLEWHFDIAGLIEKGEAIDVNTLENNPYR